MRGFRVLLWSTVLVAFGVAQAGGRSEPAKDAPYYQEGSQYTAVWEQARQSWRLVPAEGAPIVVSAQIGTGCASQPAPKGLWLVTRDAEGRPELLAPSSTALPAGHGGVLALKACGQAGPEEAAVTAPQALIDWLVQSAGAVMVK